MTSKLKFILLSSISAFSLLSLAVGTFAWFNNAFTFSGIDGKISGDSAAAYFAYGDGTTENTAYGIRTARQLYNLAWLQYNGNFNKDKDDDGEIDQQYYFEIDPSIDEIDMSDYVLPPIGTKDNPFLGSFNGNGKTIKSLTISNKTNLSKPNAIEYNKQPEIVGMFGVVGEIDDTLTYAYDPDINEVKDVTLDTITVESKTGQTLIGLAAGYMNGEMSGVKVKGTATIDVDGQKSTALTGIDGVENLSDYALVGYTTNLGNSSNSYSQKLSEYFSMGGSGVDPTWGGSLNVKNYNHWLYYLSKVKGYDGNKAMSQSDNTLTGTGYKGVFTSSSTYNPEDDTLLFLSSTSRYVKLNVNGTGFYYTNSVNNTFTWEDSVSGNVYGYKITFDSNFKIGSKTQKIFYLNRYSSNPTSGALLRFYSSAGGYGDSSLESYSFTPYAFHIYRTQIGAYYPLKFTDTKTWTEQKTNTVASDNSGYITGSTGSSASNGAVKMASYPISHICNSISDTTISMKKITLSHGFKNIAYNDSTLEILTYKEGTGWVLIEDSHNKNHAVENTAISGYTKTNMKPETLFRDYKKYNKSRDKLDSEVLSGTKKIHAIHFDAPASGYGIGGANNIQTYTNVKIDGYSGSYKMPAGTIDFKIHDKGVINFFAGAYNSADVNMSFFSLYKIERDGSNNISSIKEIRRIYDNPDYASDDTQNPYIYSYTDAVPDGATEGGLVKNLDLSLRVTSVPVKNALYYFELPVNAGEYCMAISSATTNQGAYLMYLDIGASGSDKDDVKAYSITTISGEKSFPSGVDFLPIAVTGNGGSTIGVKIASGNQGVIAFTITNKDIDVDDSDSIGVYSYRNETNYAESSPGENQFTCNLSGQPPGSSAGGTRVLSITLKPVVGQTTYNIEIIDQLDNSGAVTGTPTYTVNGSSSSLAAINSLLSGSGKNVNTSLSDTKSLRNLTIAATLVRTSQSGAFTTAYNTSNCSYADKKIDIHLEKGTTDVSITVTTGYTVIIGENTYNPGTSPVA